MTEKNTELTEAVEELRSANEAQRDHCKVLKKQNRDLTKELDHFTEVDN